MGRWCLAQFIWEITRTRRLSRRTSRISDGILLLCAFAQHTLTHAHAHRWKCQQRSTVFCCVPFLAGIASFFFIQCEIVGIFDVYIRSHLISISVRDILSFRITVVSLPFSPACLHFAPFFFLKSPRLSRSLSLSLTRSISALSVLVIHHTIQLVVGVVHLS